MVSTLRLRAAVRALDAGGVVAYPTEGVWGLGCDPLDPQAVERVLRLKRRDWRKGLILIAADYAQLRPFVYTPSNSALRRAQATWPGPTTWIFPAADTAPPWISGDHDSIAVRVTAHPVAAALCRTFGGALVSTSANRTGQPPAMSAAAVRLRFGSGISALVPGALGGLDRPTPIRHVASGALLRR